MWSPGMLTCLSVTPIQQGVAQSHDLNLSIQRATSALCCTSSRTAFSPHSALGHGQLYWHEQLYWVQRNASLQGHSSRSSTLRQSSSRSSTLRQSWNPTSGPRAQGARGNQSWMPHTMLAGSEASIFFGYGRPRLFINSMNSSLLLVSRGLSVFSSPTVEAACPL
jgi:hypothetical protein